MNILSPSDSKIAKFETKINVFVMIGLLIEMLVIGFLVGLILVQYKIITP